MSDPHPEREPDRPDPASAVRPLLREPDSVADAVDLDVRLAALGDWLHERRTYVRANLLLRATARRDEDGAAPTWRLDDATVTLTDPKPKAYVADADAFGRWHANRDGVDVDRIDVRPGSVERVTDDVAVHVRVHAPEAALADFAGAMQATAVDDREARAAIAEYLDDNLTVERQLVVADGALDRLIDEGEIVVAGTDDGGYVAVAGGSGEVVPGVSVRPPGDATIQVRPSQRLRDRIRRELDDTLHPPLSTVEGA